MRCEEIGSLLDLSDVDARCDPAAVRSHLAGCPACADRWPEALWLIPDRIPATLSHPSRRRIWMRPAAAAVTAIALAGTAVLASLDRTQAVAPEEVRQAALHPSSSAKGPRTVVSTLSHETVVLDRGHRFESRVSQAVWTPPPPSCLRAERSGS
jgi:hypothetical protein